GVRAGAQSHAGALECPDRGRAVPGEVEMEVPEIALRLVALVDADVVVAPRGDAIRRGGHGAARAQVARVGKRGDLLTETIEFVGPERIEATILRQLARARADVRERVREQTR